ncbi:MAG: rod shape-determining protein MreD [Alphaproteobacteria bacterium]|nr:rod shape-determining protein MreD [Alphaproteobacteria bacterium]MDX5368374.1 rod shape-determining protein MreD [Alphaproteobacteria bacterium]MDX5463169.1 rod shape-determining protein MreD [Alphaproteobacteria bacterium]
MSALPRGGRRALVSAVPVATCLLVMLFGATLTGTVVAPIVTPPLVLAAIFFWTLNRADLMPVAAAFGIGLAQDFLSGTPLGTWALAATLACGMTHAQRRALAARPFPLAWIGFAGVAGVSVLMVWGLVSVAALAPPPVSPVLIQYLLLLGAYPPIALVLGRAQLATLRYA